LKSWISENALGISDMLCSLLLLNYETLGVEKHIGLFSQHHSLMKFSRNL
jgi:hypothetical protein